MDPRELAALDENRLRDWLTERAQEARSWLVAEEYDRLRELLVLVREAADFASGTALSLLEVAEAYIAPLGGRHFGHRELQVQRFLRIGQAAEDLLNELLRKPMLVDVNRLSIELRSGVETLLREGVLLRDTAGVSIAPGMLGPVRELLSPPAFRMWSTVQGARQECANQDPTSAALLIAGRVGVTVEEAKRFLAQFPLSSRRTVSGNRSTFVPTGPSDQGGADVGQDDSRWQIAGAARPDRPAALEQRN
jgi:hypothetical protein